MSEGHGVKGYGTYWLAWLALLVITLVMVFIGSAPLLILGMATKAAVIFLLFMHLKFERRRLAWTVLLGIFATAAVLSILITPDGRAM